MLVDPASCTVRLRRQSRRPPALEGPAMLEGLARLRFLLGRPLESSGATSSASSASWSSTFPFPFPFFFPFNSLPGLSSLLSHLHFCMTHHVPLNCRVPGGVWGLRARRRRCLPLPALHRLD